MKGLHAGLSTTVSWAQRGMSMVQQGLSPRGQPPSGALFDPDHPSHLEQGRQGGLGASPPCSPTAAPLEAGAQGSASRPELPSPWEAMEGRLEGGVSLQQAVEEEMRSLFGAEFDHVGGWDPPLPGAWGAWGARGPAQPPAG